MADARDWWRRGFLVVALFGVCLAASTTAASAAKLVETWRSPWATPRAVGVVPADHSVWAVLGDSLTHLSSSGGILSTQTGFTTTEALVVSPRDGALWVGVGARVLHLDATGALLQSVGGFLSPAFLAVDPRDGSCWVGDRGKPIPYAWGWQHTKVVHLSKDARVLYQSAELEGLRGLAVDPNDGSCWYTLQGHEGDPPLGSIILGNDLVHIKANGAELLRMTGLDYTPSGVAVNPFDGSVWVTTFWTLYRFSRDGQLLWQEPADTWIMWGEGSTLVVDPRDGSLWAIPPGDSMMQTLEAYHFTPDGTQLAYFSGRGPSLSLAVDPGDGSCWVGEGRLLSHLTAEGALLWSQRCDGTFSSVVVDPSDSSVWCGGQELVGFLEDYSKLLHLDSSGAELTRREDVWDPQTLFVDPGDRSLWLSSGGYYQHGFRMVGSAVAHLTGDTLTTLWSDPMAWEVARGMGVNTSDGSYWYAHGPWPGGPDTLVHADVHGDELWSGGHFGTASRLVVNGQDGSCTLLHAGVTNWDTQESIPTTLTKLASDGSVVWSTAPADLGSAVALALDPNTGCYWVGVNGTWSYGAGYQANGAVLLFSADGQYLYHLGGFTSPTSLSVDAADSSLWIVDTGQGTLAHLAADGTETGRMTTLAAPASAAANSADGTCWVADGPQMVHVAALPSLGAQAVDLSPGQTAQVPIVLDIGDLQIDRLSFTVAIARTWGATRFISPLGFTPASGLAPSPVARAMNLRLTVRWTQPFAAPLTGRVVLGTLQVPVAAGTPAGTTFRLTATPEHASLGGTPVPLVGEDPTTLTVAD